MTKGKCVNCGGDEAIHRWDTLQCPFGGREAPFPRKTEYIASTYEDEKDIRRELTEALKWKREIEELCIVNFLEMTTPKETIKKLINCEVAMALDPIISQEAINLIEKYGGKYEPSS